MYMFYRLGFRFSISTYVHIDIDSHNSVVPVHVYVCCSCPRDLNLGAHESQGTWDLNCEDRV